MIVKNPLTEGLLALKTYPIGTKRICIDSGYFEIYNRDNVELVDISDAPLEKKTRAGLIASGQSFVFDSVVLATAIRSNDRHLVQYRYPRPRRAHAAR